MKLFDDIPLEEESLFRNDEVLGFDYLPEMLPHRLEEKKWITSKNSWTRNS